LSRAAIERHASDPAALRDNLLGLVRLARAFAMPIVVGTTSHERCGPFARVLADETRSACRVERFTADFWSDPSAVAAVRAQGRRDLLVAGIDPEDGLAGLALGAWDAGFRVTAVGDASAGGSASDQRIGAMRLSAAGIEVTSWVAVMAEFSSASQSKPDPADSAALNDSLAHYHHSGTRGWRDDRLVLGV
jgi:nicotinamidase-related amidase